MQSIEATGSPAPQQRHLLRIIEADPHGPAVFMSGKSVDFVRNKYCQHLQTPEKKSVMGKLYEWLDEPVYKDKAFETEYDFGDCSTHDITIVGRKPPTDFFMCTDGEGHGVAEDAGGVHRWGNLKAASKVQRPNKEQRDKTNWFEESASNRDSRGLRDGAERRWAKGQVNRRLGKLAGKALGFT